MATEGVEPDYVRAEILPEFFRAFWVRLLLRGSAAAAMPVQPMPRRVVLWQGLHHAVRCVPLAACNLQLQLEGLRWFLLGGVDTGRVDLQVRRMALDRRNYRQLVETTVELANKVPLPSFLVSRGFPGSELSCSCNCCHVGWHGHGVCLEQGVTCATPGALIASASAKHPADSASHG